MMQTVTLFLHFGIVLIGILLQAAFSSLTFELLGDSTAQQYFAMNPSSGVITTTRSIQGQDINFNVSRQWTTD